MTQKQWMLEHMLRGWTSSSVFLDEHISRFGARIHDLRKDGYQIERRRVTRGTHEYRVVKTDSSGNLLLMGVKPQIAPLTPRTEDMNGRSL